MAFSKSHKQIECISSTAKQQNTFSTSSVIKVENRIFMVLNDSEMKKKTCYDKNLRWGECIHLEDPSKKNLSAQLLFESQYKFLWTACKDYYIAAKLMFFEYFFPTATTLPLNVGSIAIKIYYV